MRMMIAVLGMIVMSVVTSGVAVLGVMGFTPTKTCSGMCAAPMLMVLLGSTAIWLFATFVTWFRAVRKPRALWPWFGAGLSVGVYYVSLFFAEMVL